MAVIDPDQVLTRRVDRAERLQLLAWVDDVTRGGRRMDVRAPDHARYTALVPGKETAGLARRFSARMRDDLIAGRLSDPQRVDYAEPPAIAGITMTSLPSGTAAPVPPLARASSSPMYTFTYVRIAPLSSRTRARKPGCRRSMSVMTSASVPARASSLVCPPVASRSAPGRRTVTATLSLP